MRLPTAFLRVCVFMSECVWKMITINIKDRIGVSVHILRNHGLVTVYVQKVCVHTVNTST